MAVITVPYSGKSANKSSRKRAVYYPTGDGKPMAEDVEHRKLMGYGCDSLEVHFADRPDVYVAGNDFIYYEEGNAKARVSPDCYVVIGVPKRRRKSYKIWEENGVTPAVIFEFTSKATYKEDVEIKQPLYEQTLRAKEYFRFDPTGDYLDPRLQGVRLHNGTYQPIELRNNRMFSEQLGLELVIEGENLRFYDPVRKEWLRTYEQAEARGNEAIERAEREAEQAEIERQRAESAQQLAAREALRADLEAEHARREAERAQSEAERAESEKQRAEAAEAELTRLLAELEALRRLNP